MTAPLTERERAVLEAVIETYVQTAEPAGSRTIAQRYSLGLSPATIRNTMSDLEEKGYLYHPHTSAGRIPTDLAYRVYVDYLMRPPAVAPAEAQHIRGQLEGQRAAVETILSRAAQVLGVLTNELGVAVTPTIDEAIRRQDPKVESATIVQPAATKEEVAAAAAHSESAQTESSPRLCRGFRLAPTAAIRLMVFRRLISTPSSHPSLA